MKSMMVKMMAAAVVAGAVSASAATTTTTSPIPDGDYVQVIKTTKTGTSEKTIQAWKQTDLAGVYTKVATKDVPVPAAAPAAEITITLADGVTQKTLTWTEATSKLVAKYYQVTYAFKGGVATVTSATKFEVYAMMNGTTSLKQNLLVTTTDDYTAAVTVVRDEIAEQFPFVLTDKGTLLSYAAIGTGKSSGNGSISMNSLPSHDEWLEGIDKDGAYSAFSIDLADSANNACPDYLVRKLDTAGGKAATDGSLTKTAVQAVANKADATAAVKAAIVKKFKAGEEVK